MADIATGKDEPQPPVGLAPSLEAPAQKHHKRSTGLRIFDLVLYPLITNVGVFVISVGATYLTTRGGDKDAVGKLVYGKTGEFFHKRGKWLVGKFKGMGMEPETAEMSKMVFFSFADGSVMAPLIKLFEDRREKIGRWCDKKLGTTPSDPDAYDKEPKQSWMSVLGGRAVTAAVVVNTAVALNTKVMKDETGAKVSFNDKMFINPGIKLGEWIKSKPDLARKFGKYEVGELAKVSIFEAFYTSVCTAGLYFSSRMFARGLNKHKEKKEQEQAREALAGHGTQDTPSLAASPMDASRFIEEQKETHTWAGDKVQKLVNSAPAKAPASHSERYESKRREPALMGM